ncbi:hypothetical protein Gotur_004303 [Gossypium turneri]
MLWSGYCRAFGIVRSLRRKRGGKDEADADGIRDGPRRPRFIHGSRRCCHTGDLRRRRHRFRQQARRCRFLQQLRRRF